MDSQSPKILPPAPAALWSHVIETGRISSSIRRPRSIAQVLTSTSEVTIPNDVKKVPISKF
ncbi:MAG: hypothetical protein Q9193_004679, partial [Seirophora villosa]